MDSSNVAEKETSQPAESAIRLLEEWLADESEYDEETWPEIKKALDEHRLSSRQLL